MNLNALKRKISYNFPKENSQCTCHALLGRGELHVKISQKPKAKWHSQRRRRVCRGKYPNMVFVNPLASLSSSLSFFLQI